MRECSSNTICHVSHVICHVSRVMCHLSRVTYHMSLFFTIKKKINKIKKLHFFVIHKKIEQSGGASWWRVCYQRGLPRLVFIQLEECCYQWVIILSDLHKRRFFHSFEKSLGLASAELSTKTLIYFVGLLTTSTLFAELIRSLN